MSATTAQAVSEQSRSSAISLRWIISGREDLVWFIGSVASSYALFALYVGGILPLIPMVVAWAILIDAPHVFATFSRTYFDRTERQSRKRLLWARTDNFLDRAFLLIAFTYPFVAFVARDPAAMKRVPVQLHAGINGLELILLVATIAFTAAWLFRQGQRAVQGLALNVPKYLLLAAAIPMHWVVLLTPMPNKAIAIVAILTIYHNLQYHRLVWFHNKKYTSSEDCKERYGAAELISRRFLYYITFGILFGLWYHSHANL